MTVLHLQSITFFCLLGDPDVYSEAEEKQVKFLVLWQHTGTEGSMVHYSRALLSNGPSSLRPRVLSWISSASRALFLEQDETQIYFLVLYFQLAKVDFWPKFTLLRQVFQMAMPAPPPSRDPPPPPNNPKQQVKGHSPPSSWQLRVNCSPNWFGYIPSLSDQGCLHECAVQECCDENRLRVLQGIEGLQTNLEKLRQEMALLNDFLGVSSILGLSQPFVYELSWNVRQVESIIIMLCRE